MTLFDENLAHLKPDVSGDLRLDFAQKKFFESGSGAFWQLKFLHMTCKFLNVLDLFFFFLKEPTYVCTSCLGLRLMPVSEAITK